MEIADQIYSLNPQPGERFSANYKLGDDDMVSVVLTPELIADYVTALPDEADIWIGVNPVDHTKIPPGKRGKACDVTRLAALYADLDVKDGGCDTYETAFAIVNDLAGLLYEEPAFIVYSGHGIQPYWTVDPDDKATNAEIGVLLRRWGQLVKLVAKRRGAQADSVFDLSRILRVVTTINNKSAPVDVCGEMRTGGPMGLAQIDDRLNEAGVHTPQPAEADLDDAAPTRNGWSHSECNYCTKAFEAWATAIPGERHPQLINWFTRLESMRLLGCLTFSQYQDGYKIAADRFTALCENGIGSTPRTVKPFEIESCHAWGEVKAAAKTPAQLAQEVGKHQHDILGGIINPDAAQANTGASSPPPPPPPPPPGDTAQPEPEAEPEDLDLFAHIFEAESDFWSATPALKQIYETCMHRMVSPWAVFAYCAARMLYLVPSSVKLPALIGGKGSLNWFALVVDASGGGKSAASAVAEELVYPAFPVEIVERTPGSGEGIVTQFYGPPIPPDKTPRRREAVMFTTDEIDTLTAMGQRQGGTTLSTLRTAFSGGTLGFSYATKGRDVHVIKHTYRMTLVVNAQPARVGGLLADHGGGTPQRFMWFPGNDTRPTAAGADEDYIPHGIAIPALALLGDKTIGIPMEARAEILANREDSLHGRLDTLDGHALFAREKLAYALALMDGRTDMGAEDWRLSGIAAEVSSRTRAWAQAELAKSQEVEAQEAGRIKGVGFAAADDEKVHQQAKKARRVQDWVLGRLKSKGPQSQRDLDRAIASRDRAYLKGALDVLVANKMIAFEKDENAWYIP